MSFFSDQMPLFLRRISSTETLRTLHFAKPEDEENFLVSELRSAQVQGATLLAVIVAVMAFNMTQFAHGIVKFLNAGHPLPFWGRFGWALGIFLVVVLPVFRFADLSTAAMHIESSGVRYRPGFLRSAVRSAYFTRTYLGFVLFLCAFLLVAEFFVLLGREFSK